MTPGAESTDLIVTAGQEPQVVITETPGDEPTAEGVPMPKADLLMEGGEAGDEGGVQDDDEGGLEPQVVQPGEPGVQTSSSSQIVQEPGGDYTEYSENTYSHTSEIEHPLSSGQVTKQQRFSCVCVV